MPRVKQVVAAKDYPDYGIVKGEKHYYWVLKTGPRSSRKYRQKEPPKPSQLTTSEFLGEIGDLSLEVDTYDDVEQFRDLQTRIEEIGQEQNEKYESMPENFQQGDTGQTLEERAQNCESWASDIDQAISDYESKMEELTEDKEREHDEAVAAWEEYDDRIAEGEDVSEPEMDRPDDDERDFDEERSEALTELREACACPF